ncbi:MAG: hypothetical protein JJT94_11350, partial [Bernardetiaceae bacterium]|nr:hypothetical protein [Bernardetiaceae bacterium]
KTAHSQSSATSYASRYSYDANGNILSLSRRNKLEDLIDDLQYDYNTLLNNRLHRVHDLSGDPTGVAGNQSYSYDAIGNLTSNPEDDVLEIEWNTYGKIASVTKSEAQIFYQYDALGNRSLKKIIKNEEIEGEIVAITKKTHYLRDATGNVLATYEDESLSEWTVYGSSRLGVVRGENPKKRRTLGKKFFELSNHLGNVLVVVSDNKEGSVSTNSYITRAVSETDYYAFGMAMGERMVALDVYRFGFNTQEKTPEIAPDTYTAEFWQYDSRVARRWNVDPVFVEWENSYAVNRNNPIGFADPAGDVPLLVSAGAGALIGGVAGGVIGFFTTKGNFKKKLKGAGKGALTGATAGTIIGSGAWIVAGGLTAGVGLTGTSAIVVNGASGFAAGGAQSIVGQAWEFLFEDRTKFSTLEVVTDAVIGIPSSMIGGVVGSKAKGELNKHARKKAIKAFKAAERDIKKEVRKYSKSVAEAYGYSKAQSRKLYKELWGVVKESADKNISTIDISIRTSATEVSIEIINQILYNEGDKHIGEEKRK